MPKSTTMRGPVLIVGCGFPQLGLLRTARELGIETVGVDLNPNAIAVPEATRFVKASTGDVDAVAAAVKSSGAIGITTSGSELALTTACAVADRLGLPFYADPETIHRCQAKDAMRAAYEAAHVEVPRFAGCSSLGDAERFVDEVGLPVVVKPAHGWGQRGVARVVDRSQLAAKYAEADAISAPHGGGVVVETCLVGPEMSVNGWMEDGELRAYCVTDREVFPGDSPLGVMRNEVCPTRLGEAASTAAIEAASKAARALGLKRGPCYTQVCMTSRGAVVFETAARCGGGFDADISKLISGVDFYTRLLGIALGDRSMELSSASSNRHAAAMVRFLAPPAGEVREVRGLDAARELAGVLDADVYARVGDRLTGLVNAASRVGHLLVTASSRDELVRRADEAERTIEIVVAI